MCNLSVGLFERGWNQCDERKTRGFVINLLHAQMQVDFIARMVECIEKYVVR